MIVAHDTVAQRRKALLNALHDDRVRERIADVLHFLVRGGAGQQQTALVADSDAAHEAAAGDRHMNDRDVIGQLGLERAVEVLRATDAYEAVGVGELGEDSDLVAVLELAADGHGAWVG